MRSKGIQKNVKNSLHPRSSISVESGFPGRSCEGMTNNATRRAIDSAPRIGPRGVLSTLLGLSENRAPDDRLQKGTSHARLSTPRNDSIDGARARLDRDGHVLILRGLFLLDRLVQDAYEL